MDDLFAPLPCSQAGRDAKLHDKTMAANVELDLVEKARQRQTDLMEREQIESLRNGIKDSCWYVKQCTINGFVHGGQFCCFVFDTLDHC